MKQLTIAAIVAAVSVNAYAADVEGGVFKSTNQDLMPNFFFYTPPPSEPFLQEQAPVFEEKEAQATVSAAATGISYFEIRLVGSTTYGGWESITGTQTSTAGNHGGTELYVGVVQQGYGNINNATMNGISKAPFTSQALCGADLHYCNTGETITGWLYYFDFSGQSSGSFSVSSSSTASPFGYWSDSIYIM